MPVITPIIKINSVKMWGQEFVTVVLTGNVYDDA